MVKHPIAPGMRQQMVKHPIAPGMRNNRSRNRWGSRVQHSAQEAQKQSNLVGDEQQAIFEGVMRANGHKPSYSIYVYSPMMNSGPSKPANDVTNPSERIG
eukprot:1159417-Pelagomonas_calceolata.AAC.5